MPQNCKICEHSSRGAIDIALTLNRDSLRAIAAEYGVSKDSLRRHFNGHLERSEPRQDVLPRQVSGESQTATPEPEPGMDRYYAFIDRFCAETAAWGFDPEELRTFLAVGLEVGDLPGA